MSNFKILNINQIKLDKENPRLPETVARNEEEIIKYLASKTAIEDLMFSIGVNGFFPGEAIIVTPEKHDSYIVLEGNRRLVALRLLQNPGLADNIRSVRRSSEESIHRPETIPAHIVASRDDALKYLGFRHISGVQRWDPMAKARYLKLLFKQTSDELEIVKRYVKVAREIGSRSNAVRRNLDALAVYEVIDLNDFFDIQDLNERTFQFGVFYTAIGNSDIASFIGVRKDDNPTHPIVNPQSLKKESIKELTEWMFKKNEQGGTRLVESRNISKLGAVVAHDEALNILRQGVSLDHAYSATVDNKKAFLRDINRAMEYLRQANSNVHSVEPNDLDAVNMVREALKVLSVALRHLNIDRNA